MFEAFEQLCLIAIRTAADVTCKTKSGGCRPQTNGAMPRDPNAGVGRENDKDRPLRPLVGTLTGSAMAIMESVGTLVPMLALLLLSPRTATLGFARRMESRGSFDSLDSVEDANRIACAIGGQYITTVGAIIFIIGSVINFIAFALVPASILAPPLESIQVRSVV